MTIPVRPRNWLSFNLRALLLLVTLFAIACAVLSHYYLPFKQQRDAIKALNGRYGYASQRPAGPAWMRKWFGEQNFQDVVELHLEMKQITDDDLKHVAQLRHLEKLYLAHNEITDKGLAHLRGMPHLRRLSLYGTKVTGPGFEHLATCPELAEIDANTIPLSQEILTHLQKMPQLTWFATPATVEEQVLLRVAEFPNNHCLDFRYGLYCKRLTDVSVPALANIHGAASVTLNECRISPAGWNDFQPPSKCTELWLHNTPMPADVAVNFLEGGGTKQFLTLHFDSSSVPFQSLVEHLPDEPLFEATIHEDAINLSKLATLHCFSYYSEEPIHKLCARLHVKTLSFNTNREGGAVGLVKDVEELQVNCVATPAMFSGIGKLKQLRLLNVTGMAIEDFSMLGNLIELETLVLPSNNLPGENFRFLEKLTKLKQLKLSGNQLDAENLRAIGTMKQLRNLRIDFVGNQINDETFELLRACKNLEMLSCNGAPITDKSIPLLCFGWPKLRFVNLTKTKISEAGRAEIERAINQRLIFLGDPLNVE